MPTPLNQLINEKLLKTVNLHLSQLKLYSNYRIFVLLYVDFGVVISILLGIEK